MYITSITMLLCASALAIDNINTGHTNPQPRSENDGSTLHPSIFKCENRITGTHPRLLDALLECITRVNEYRSKYENVGIQTFGPGKVPWPGLTGQGTLCTLNVTNYFDFHPEGTFAAKDVIPTLTHFLGNDCLGAGRWSKGWSMLLGTASESVVRAEMNLVLDGVLSGDASSIV